MHAVIDAYLRELERRLPSPRRRRFLAETEGHLRDRANALVAAGVEPDEAERQAVEAFGRVDEVARRFAEVAALHATRRATLLALGALVLLVLPLYAIPENTFGPAQWQAKPGSISVAQGVAVALWFSALAVGAAAALTALLDGPRVARRLLAMSVGLGWATFAAGAVAGALWLDAAPWTPLWSVFGLVLPSALALLALAAGALVWVRAAQPQ